MTIQRSPCVIPSTNVADGVPAANARRDQRSVHDEVKKRRPLQARERQRARREAPAVSQLPRVRSLRESQRAIRGKTSPASGGHRSISRGHQANASCSWSGVTSCLGALGQPRLSHEHHHPVRQPQQRLAAAPARRRPTTPPAAPARGSRWDSRRDRPPRPPPTPSARPTRRPTAALRPASQRPSAERVTHSAATLAEASPETRRRAQRNGCNSIARPSLFWR